MIFKKINATFIPFTNEILQRTERAPKDRNIAETDPKRFAELLIEKLKVVVQQREKDERVKETISRMDAVSKKNICVTVK